MGKIRVKTLGDAEQEKKQKQEAKKRQEAKRVEKSPEAAPVVETAEPKKAKIATTEAVTKQNEKAETVEKAPKAKTAKFAKKKRSDNYQTVAQLVDDKRVYSLKDALNLLPKLKRAKFDEAVELHINTQGTGISVSTILPHGTGKDVRVAIANEDLIAQIEKNQINFDVLIAEPSMMPKLARVAKILGPRGLMPNPKNGTVTTNPAEAAKKFQGGQVHYKTEAKFPLLHMMVGKISFGEEKLADNVKAIAKVLPANQVKNATLKLTMSPAVHVDYTSI